MVSIVGLFPSSFTCHWGFRSSTNILDMFIVLLSFTANFFFVELEIISPSIDLHGLGSKVQAFLLGAVFIVNSKMSNTKKMSNRKKNVKHNKSSTFNSDKSKCQTDLLNIICQIIYIYPFYNHFYKKI